MQCTLTYVVKILLALLGAGVVALLLSACGKSEQDKTTLRVAYLPILADVIFFTAIEKNYFQDEGIEIEAIRVGSANQAIDAIATKRADAAIMLGFTTLITVGQKEPGLFKITQSAYETEKYYTSRILVPKASTVKNISELKGKKIATYSGLTQRMNLELVLEKFMDPQKDIEIIQVEQNLQVPGLIAGNYDALFTIDPYATAALVNGEATSLLENPRFKHILQPFPTAANIISVVTISNNSEAVKKFNRAMDRAQEWVKGNAKEAALLATNPKYTSMSPEVAANAGTYEWRSIGEQDVDAVQKLAELMHKYKLIPKTVDVKTLFF